VTVTAPMNDDIFDPDHIEDSMSVELAHAPEVDVDDDELDPGWSTSASSSSGTVWQSGCRA
jgi:hypothetical protein